MFINNKTTDFNALCQSLKFEKDFSKASYLVGEHLKLVNKKFSNYLSKYVSLDPQLNEALKELPEANYFRLLSSPYFCELLSIAEQKNGHELSLFHNQINSAIVAEIKSVNSNFQHSLNPKWTIDGDIVLDAKIEEIAPPVRTNCGINLNYQSAIHNTGKPGIGGYDFSTALKHKERIDTAKQLISKVSPSANSMVEMFTTNIQFRQNTLKPNVINSSTHTSIGLIRCDNFHKIHSDLPEIVDMLVHESIHQYLHLFEEQLFDFIDTVAFPTKLKDARIFNSPWSGNSLDLRSYTHAILVWYGLVNFWEQYINSNIQHAEISSMQARQKLQESLFGFINSNSVLDNFNDHKILLNKEYEFEVTQIQNELKERYKNIYAEILL